MKKKLKLFYSAAFAAAMLGQGAPTLAADAGAAATETEAKGLAVGDPAPAWKDLAGVDDQQHSLADLKDAKAVVVVFTCNHCPVAKAYEDRLIELDADYADKGVELVAINVDRREPRRQFLMHVDSLEPPGKHVQRAFDHVVQIGRRRLRRRESGELREFVEQPLERFRLLHDRGGALADDSSGFRRDLRPFELPAHHLVTHGVVRGQAGHAGQRAIPDHHIGIWSERTNPLRQILQNLSKVAAEGLELERGALQGDASLAQTLLQDTQLVGQRVAHDLASGRHAWVQVARGVVLLNGQRLSAGDGAAITQESRLALEGVDKSELLLFDLG